MRVEHNSDWQENWMWYFLNGLIFSPLHAFSSAHVGHVCMCFVSDPLRSVGSLISWFFFQGVITALVRDILQFWWKYFVYFAILVLQGSADTSLGMHNLIVHIYLSWVIFLICKMGIIIHFSSHIYDMFNVVTGIFYLVNTIITLYKLLGEALYNTELDLFIIWKGQKILT